MVSGPEKSRTRQCGCERVVHKNKQSSDERALRGSHLQTCADIGEGWPNDVRRVDLPNGKDAKIKLSQPDHEQLTT
jgi:hypothetical protein